MSKIAIVSDSSTILNSIQAKLVLLREDDTIIKCNSSELYKYSSTADIILFHVSEITDITLTAITNIKKNSNVIILLVEEINPKTLLNAYDCGITDFCNINITNFELLIKIINAKKSLNQYKTIERLKTSLRDKGVLKPNSDIYEQISDIVNANFFSEILNSSMLAVSIDEISHQKFLLDNVESRLSMILRDSDFIINYAEFKYLIILPKTEIENAAKVFDKLKNKYNLEMKGILFTYTEESAKDLRNKIERLEVEHAKSGVNLYIDNAVADYEFETEKDWLSNELTEEHKNYKLFQNIFNKKLESVIEPAFYRTKQKYEKSFPNTKIKYFTDKNRAEFMLINFDKTNSLQIIYKNSAKVTVNIQYSGLDAPENENFEIIFSKLNTRGLMEILDRFINKFNANGGN